MKGWRIVWYKNGKTYIVLYETMLMYNKVYYYSLSNG